MTGFRTSNVVQHSPFKAATNVLNIYVLKDFVGFI